MANVPIEESKVRFRSVAAIVGSMITIAVVMIGATWKLASLLSEMNNQIHALSTALDDVKNSSYTMTRASEQALRTAIENPQLRVPDPRDPARLIVVYSSNSAGGNNGTAH